MRIMGKSGREVWTFEAWPRFRFKLNSISILAGWTPEEKAINRKLIILKIKSLK